jgi:hypothetical protein
MELFASGSAYIAGRDGPGEETMAKARKAARKSCKTRKPAARRTAQLKGRKVTKRKTRRTKSRSGILGAIGEAVGPRTRLGGHNRFEDQ